MKLVRSLLCTVLLLLQFTPAVFAGWAHGSASYFNSGATQVNLNFVGVGGAYPFVDMAKAAAAPTASNVAISPANITTTGLPLTGSWTKYVSLPLTSQKPGDYYLIWSGGGPNTVMFNPGGTSVSGSLNGANGIYRFNPGTIQTANPNQDYISLTVGVQTPGTGYSPVTSLSVVNVNDYPAWQADPNAFTPEFIAAISNGKFGVVRFLNWMGSAFGGSNQAMWTDWLSRKPTNYNNFYGDEWRPNWWAGNPDNGGSGNDYTLTTPAAPTYIFGNGAPVDKQIMHVQFNQNATYIGSTDVSFSGNTVNWPGHIFTGNEPVAFAKTSTNLPSGLWDVPNYYVVASSIVPGVSFQISLTPGGSAISSFGTGASGTYYGVRLPTLNINGTGAYPIRVPYGDAPGYVGGSSTSGTSILTLGSPGQLSWPSHGLSTNAGIVLTTTGTLPSGLSANVEYFAIVVDANTLELAATPGGAAINFTGSQSGTQTAQYVYSNDLPITTNGGSPVYGTMVFDADMQSWLKVGADLRDNSVGLNNGVPPEVLLNLAIKVRAHPWFTSSAFALDPMTDFWPSFAAYVRDHAPPWMIPRYEGVNEEWNSGGSFWGAHYAWNKSWLHWGLQFNADAWQGKTLSTLGQAINAVYGGTPDGTKYWLTDGLQTVAYYTGPQVTAQAERLTSSYYVNQSAPAQSGYSKSPAYDYATHVNIADYLGSFDSETLTELQLAIDYSSANANNPTAQTANLNTYVDALVGSTISGTSILSMGSPGQLLWPSHGLSTGDQVVLYTTGSLPTGLSPYGVYWVTVVDANTLELSTSNGGALINFTGSQSGTQTATVVDIVNKPTVANIAAQTQAFASWAAGYTNLAGKSIGLHFYEGGFSFFGPVQDATTTVSAITAPGATTTVTVGSTTTLTCGGYCSAATGVAARVGGAVSFSGVGGMTQLNTSSFSASFTGGGSANITGTNSLILNQAVSFLNNGGQGFVLPSEIVPGAPYYVVSAGNPFQISATRGGTPITFSEGTISFYVLAYPGWFVTNVSGQQITLDVDSSTFGTYTSGGTLTYTTSAQQMKTFGVASMKAPDLQGILYGNTTPIPSLFSSISSIGAVFPSKFQLNGSGGDPWGELQPSVYPPYPTTGEWPALQAFSPNYH